MGISGLLPLLKSIQKSTHINAWAGRTVAIDAYGWLHRGAVACAVDLALSNPTRRYVEFAMNRVRLLQHYGVIPFLVFDGDYLPGKASTEAARQSRRDAAKARGLELLRLGRSNQAYLELQKAIDVTPEMAKDLIDELRELNIRYVVAPYEADAQMAYLERVGLVDAILSEDSDLLVFGVKCLLTKLDQYGACIEINRDNFSAVKDISLAGWSDAEFRRMAILSGCDYLSNIPKMGLKTAHRLVRRYKSVDKLIQALRLDGSYSVPNGYEKAFKEADFTFQYQRVFCPISKSVVHCNGAVLSQDDLKGGYFGSIGAAVLDDVAAGIAEGRLHPMTKDPFSQVPSRSSLGRSNNGRHLQGTRQMPKTKTITQFFGPLQEVSQNKLSQSAGPNSKRLVTLGNSHDKTKRSLDNPPTTTPENNLHGKRLRLCEEEPDLKLPLQTSRFFESNTSSKVIRKCLSERSMVTRSIDGGILKRRASQGKNDENSETLWTMSDEWKRKFTFESRTLSRDGNQVPPRPKHEGQDDQQTISAVSAPSGKQISDIWRLSYKENRPK